MNPSFRSGLRVDAARGDHVPFGQPAMRGSAVREGIRDDFALRRACLRHAWVVGVGGAQGKEAEHTAVAASRR